MRRIVIRGLKPEYSSFVTSIQGWAQQPSLEEFENLLSSQELLAKQLASVFVKGEENAFVANKRNFKGKQEICYTLDPQVDHTQRKKEYPNN